MSPPGVSVGAAHPDSGASPRASVHARFAALAPGRVSKKVFSPEGTPGGSLRHLLAAHLVEVVVAGGTQVAVP